MDTTEFSPPHGATISPVSAAAGAPPAVAAAAAGAEVMTIEETPRSEPHTAASASSTQAVNDQNTLSRIADVMANGRVSRFPSPGYTSSSNDAAGSAAVNTGADADLLDRLHRHLIVVYSLRSFPKGHVGDAKDEYGDKGISGFFLPSHEEGNAYIQCYFDHATSTYRYLNRKTIERLTDVFYDQAGASTQPDDVVLLLVLMAIGCLWTPSWTGAEPQSMTRKAVRLYRVAKRQLETIDLSQPRLRMVQVHVALSHLHLGMSHFRSAWLTFGTAARLSQLLKLHRKSPDGTPALVDEANRQTFWSAFMMDRYLSLVLGCPAVFDERDITQPLPSNNVAPDNLSPNDEVQRMTGSIAHIKLSRILGYALRSLQSPAELTDQERAHTVVLLNAELDRWLQETPKFFHPAGPDVSDLGPFASISPFFRRQQQLVRSAYHFIKLFVHRSFLLDQFIHRLPSDQPSISLSRDPMSPEITTCVESAIQIARSVCKMKESPGAKGTYWNSAYFCFASLTVLLVYLMVYEDAPRREEIESIIEATMEGHIQLTGSTSHEREKILEDYRRIKDTLRRREDQAEMTANPYQSSWQIPPSISTNGNVTEWDPLWQSTLDMLGLDMTTGLGAVFDPQGIVPQDIATTMPSIFSL
ncbi:hypothetical protein I316_07598 [Kwoniella heveanensis BCC8398]|uniref:Xylanolytic transcriptional activator regulatory domain-containing protein n=1 Tax=Kwoniella heveanensis BCC8398 TaxID=1296120 RepID=A0A1B9GI95_9TREE|nr:hypothetical protein I316_07598 [Kwoniella heveanensis BCC8398]